MSENHATVINIQYRRVGSQRVIRYYTAHAHISAFNHTDGLPGATHEACAFCKPAYNLHDGSRGGQ